MSEKKTGAWQEHIKPIVVLTVICLVISFALSATNSITLPIIEARKAEEAAAARRVVLADADGFEDVTASLDASAIEELRIVDAYEATNGAGYVVTVLSKGYGGDITVMVGLDAAGAVTGIQLTSHNETPGLGAKAAENDFLSQYTGKTAGALEAVKGAASNDSQIAAITGATISSKAVTLAVNNAAAAVTSLGGAQ